MGEAATATVLDECNSCCSSLPEAARSTILSLGEREGLPPLDDPLDAILDAWAEDCDDNAQLGYLLDRVVASEEEKSGGGCAFADSGSLLGSVDNGESARQLSSFR